MYVLLTAGAFARILDHSVLKPEASEADVHHGAALVERLRIGFYCVQPAYVPPAPAETGLANRCLPDDELDAHVQAMAEKLRDLPPLAVNYTKMALNVANLVLGDGRARVTPVKNKFR